MLTHLRRLLGDDRAIHLAGVELCAVVVLAGGLALAATPPPTPAARLAALTDGEISPRGFARLTSRMDPAMLSLAVRLEPQAASLGRAAPSTIDGLEPAESEHDGLIGLQRLNPDDAMAWNEANPVSALPHPAAKPFVLTADGVLDEARAVECMTAVVYYEAASESVDGQRAVAQVVLNRMRHPAYPKSVCGVVFQGSNRTTGCQFTFTCDGALGRRPSADGWARARQVAVAALNGYVMKSVGDATHYHANYVAPYWSPSLLKVGSIGAHIFYRWTGSWGRPPAFSGQYGGSEPDSLRVASLGELGEPGVVEAPPLRQYVPPPSDLDSLDDLASAPGRADARASGEGGDPLAEAEVLTAANAASDAGALINPEDLDWAGRPKAKATPRVAMPNRGMF